MTDTDLWATAREWAERSGTITSDLARLALDTRRALIGEQISEPTALAAARAEVKRLQLQIEMWPDVEHLNAEVADLRDRLARVAVECAVTTAKDEVGERWVNVNALRPALGDADTLAERCPVSDAALGRCVLDAHDGDIHAWEGVAGPPGPPQRWQSSERADRIEGATDE